MENKGLLFADPAVSSFTTKGQYETNEIHRTEQWNTYEQ